MGDSKCPLDGWEKPFKSEKKRITNKVHQKFSKAKSDTTFAFVLFILTVIILSHLDVYHSESWFPVLAVILAILPFYWERQEIKKSNFPRKLLVATNQRSPIIEEYIAEKCESIPGYTEAREQAEREAREREEERLREYRAEKERKRTLWEEHREPTIRAIAEEVFQQTRFLEFRYIQALDKLYVHGRNFKFYYENVLNKTYDSIEKEMKVDYSNWKSPSVSSRRYRRSRGYGSTDDDINSVDGGPPSEASDDDG